MVGRHLTPATEPLTSFYGQRLLNLFGRNVQVHSDAQTTILFAANRCGEPTRLKSASLRRALALANTRLAGVVPGGKKFFVRKLGW